MSTIRNTGTVVRLHVVTIAAVASSNGAKSLLGRRTVLAPTVECARRFVHDRFFPKDWLTAVDSTTCDLVVESTADFEGNSMPRLDSIVEWLAEVATESPQAKKQMFALLHANHLLNSYVERARLRAAIVRAATVFDDPCDFFLKIYRCIPEAEFYSEALEFNFFFVPTEMTWRRPAPWDAATQNAALDPGFV